MPSFTQGEIEYLEYIQMLEGVEPWPEKIWAILAVKELTKVKTLWGFLGMVQFYRDSWSQRSHILISLTDLVGECGHTKAKK